MVTIIPTVAFQLPAAGPLKLQPKHQLSSQQLFSSAPSDIEEDGPPPVPKAIIEQIEDAKADLVQTCKSSTKPSLGTVQSKVQSLEDLAEMGGIGQASSHSGLLSGEWYVSHEYRKVFFGYNFHCGCMYGMAYFHLFL